MAADVSDDVADDVSLPRHTMTVMGADVAMTWLMTSALTQPNFDPTRSTGQPDPVNGQPGDGST